jgi:hypothetical protein
MFPAMRIPRHALPSVPAMLMGAVVALLGACTGDIGGTANPRAGADSPDGEGQAPRSPDSRSQCADSAVLDVGAAHVRRLNGREYGRTLVDLGLTEQTSTFGSSFADDMVGGPRGGFRVGGTVDEALAWELLGAAEQIAANANFAILAGCSPSDATAQRDCAADFIANFGRRAYRRPLTAEQRAELLGVYDDVRSEFDHSAAMTAVLGAVLNAPDFLYLFEDEPEGAIPGDVVAVDGWSMASRLSYFLWDSMPDDTLLAAAEAGELDTQDGLEAQARRMLADGRAKDTVGSFFSQWARLDRLATIEKQDDAFDAGVRGDLRVSIDRFLSDVFWDSEKGIGELFGASGAYVTDRTAPYFGVAAPGAAEGGAWVELPAGERSGLLTHPGLMALLSKSSRPDPIHRGLFVREQVLCMQIPDPPATDAGGNPIQFDITPPSPGSSNRQQFTAHTDRPECATCHGFFDPLGFAFENYDATGKFHEVDEFDNAIDASSEVGNAGDLTGTYENAVDLADGVQGSDTVADCMTAQWFRFALDRRESTEDACSNASALESFLGSGGSFVDMLIGIVRSDSFRHRRVGGLQP